jgi:hypothetical protein
VTVDRRAAERVSTETLARWLRDAITGPDHAGAPVVVWEDRGAQLLLHVGKLQVRTLEHTLVVAIDTETAELGRTPLVVRLVFGSGRDPASLVAATDELVQGDPRIAGRWGPPLRDVIWAAIVRLSDAHASKHDLSARSLSILDDHLRLTAETPVDLDTLVRRVR